MSFFSIRSTFLPLAFITWPSELFDNLLPGKTHWLTFPLPWRLFCLSTTRRQLSAIHLTVHLTEWLTKRVRLSPVVTISIVLSCACLSVCLHCIKLAWLEEGGYKKYLRMSLYVRLLYWRNDLSLIVVWYLLLVSDFPLQLYDTHTLQIIMLDKLVVMMRWITIPLIFWENHGFTAIFDVVTNGQL